MKPVLVIQNDAKEGAGQLATLIAERGLQQDTVLGFDTDYDFNYAWEHAVRIGVRFMVGAETLRELDEAVGLIDENAIYGQAFGPTYLGFTNLN